MLHCTIRRSGVSVAVAMIGHARRSAGASRIERECSMNDQVDPGRNDARSPARQRRWRVRLDDGTACRIRPVGRDDQGRLRACFAGLSAKSRRQRFFGAKQELTEADLEYLVDADGLNHLAFVAVRLDGNRRESDILGAARCIRSTPDAETAEVAMAVVDEFQGKGVGTLLLDHLMEEAREQGIRRFRFDVLADNMGLRALAKRLDGQASWSDEGALVYDCALPDLVPTTSSRDPDPASLTDLMPWWSARPPVELWMSSWETAGKVSVAVFETTAWAWYDCIFRSPLER
jgi:GNAT superfamily N-acetyltransferase